MVPSIRRLTLLCAAIALGFAMFGPARVSAQSNATVTIHLSECPAGYSGGEYFADCHDNPIGGATFRWFFDGPGTSPEGVTDANGVLETGAEPLGIIQTPPFELDSYVVFCTANDGELAIDFSYDEQLPGIVFPDRTQAEGEIICDWYDIPIAGDDGSGDPVTLPSTGVAPAGPTSSDILLLALASLASVGMAIGLRRRASVHIGVR